MYGHVTFQVRPSEALRAMTDVRSVRPLTGTPVMITVSGPKAASSPIIRLSSSSAHSARQGRPRSAKSSVRLGVSTSALRQSVRMAATISSVILL